MIKFSPFHNFSNNPFKRVLSAITHRKEEVNKPENNFEVSPAPLSEHNSFFTSERLSNSNLKPLDKDTLEIGPTEKDIRKRAKEAGLEDDDISPLIDNLKYLYKNDREKFSCIYNSDTLIKLFNLPFKKAALEKYSTQQIKLVESQRVLSKKDGLIIKQYVASSDYFDTEGDNGKRLHRILSRFQTAEDTVVYRGDKGSGMFDEVSLKTPLLIEKIKKANEENKNRTSFVIFSGFHTSYTEFNNLEYYDESQNVYTYIKNKKELSLADAMLMMPFLDKEARERVLDELRGARVVDKRFKSTTLKEGYAKEWIDERPEIASIFSEITLKKGMEGVYVPRTNWMGGQCEFILNNNPKEIVVKEASYDEKENRFYIKTRMRML